MLTKHTTIPALTTAFGLLITIALIAVGATAPRNEQALPLLTLLFMSELGLLITLGGALYGIKLWRLQREQRFLLFNAMGGIILAAALLLLGLNLWLTTAAT
jgi:hypothetical protein